MRPYSRFMIQAIDRIRHLEIEMVCPGHGVILRSYWKKFVELTEVYAKEALEYPIPNKVFMGYVSAYQNTGLLAEKIAEGIRLAGDIDVETCDIEGMDLGSVEKKLMEASAIIVGCPTFSQNILLPIYQLFAVINPIRDRGKLAAAFGSYGWSGEGNKLINSNLSNLKLKLFDEGLQVKFKPHEEVFAKCLAYGKAFGTKLLEKE
jgi:flavorubredoxin